MRTLVGFFAAVLAAHGLSSTAMAHDESRERVIRAAHELTYKASHFQRMAAQYTGYTHLSAHAGRLAQVVSHFHQVAEGSTPVSHLRRDFTNVRQSYSRLSHEFEHAHQVHHNDHIARDWHGVEHAFEELLAAVRGLKGH